MQDAVRKEFIYQLYLEEIVDLSHKIRLAYNENLKYMQSKGMLPLFDVGNINLGRQYLTIEVNGLDSPTTNQRFYKIVNGKMIDMTNRFINTINITFFD